MTAVLDHGAPSFTPLADMSAASPSAVRLEPSWRTKQRSESEAAKAEDGKPKFKTMMPSVPVAGAPESDLEALLRTLDLSKRSLGLLLRSGMDLPAFLAVDKEALTRLGLSPAEAAGLVTRLCALHAEPWTPGSLVGAGPRLSCLDLGAQLANLALQIRCMQSQLLSAERLLGAYSEHQLATLGFKEQDNCASLVASAAVVADESTHLASQARRLQARLKGPLPKDAVKGSRLRWVAASALVLLAGGGVVFLVVRRWR